MYIAEKINTVTAHATTQPRNDLTAAVAPIQLGIRSSTCEYMIVPEYNSTTTNGASTRMTTSIPMRLKKALCSLRTFQTLLKTVSTLIIIQMMSQTNARALISPNTPFVAEARILSDAFRITSIMLWLMSHEKRSSLSLSAKPKPLVTANATAMNGTKAIVQK